MSVPEAGLGTAVDAAERFLLTGLFSQAVTAAINVLETEKPINKSFAVRASFVLAQALYETGRFGEALPQLQRLLRGLCNIPCDVLMLWASLALEANRAEEAYAALGTYLSTAVPSARELGVDGSASPPLRPQVLDTGQPLELTEEQFALAARLYALEIAAKGCSRPSQALAWLQSPAASRLSLPHRLALAADIAQLLDQSKAHPGPAADTTAFTEIVAASDTVSFGATQQQHSMQQQGGVVQPQGHAASSGPMVDDSSAMRGSELAGGRPVGEPTHDSAGQEGASGWLQSSVGSITRHVRSWVQHEAQVDGKGVEHSRMQQTQLIAVAVVTSLVCYAAFTERKTLSRSINSTARRVRDSVLEFASLALTLNPNPVGR